MLMSLGYFVFEVSSLPFDEMSKESGYRHTKHEVIGQRPKYQFIGEDEQTINLKGTVYPEFNGGVSHINDLEEMAESGEKWLLVKGSGDILGSFYITSINQTQSYFLQDGTAQKITFDLTLKKGENDDN